METEREPLASLTFEAQVVEWRGPAPYFFAPVPARHVDEIRWAARMASYGWGCVPVTARIGPTVFTTSLFPRDGTYMLPIKAAVQRSAGIGLGDWVDIELRIDVC